MLFSGVPALSYSLPCYWPVVSEAYSITDCSCLPRALICLLENTFIFLYSCCFMVIFYQVLLCVMYSLSHFLLSISW